jgi:hypothetical protein
MSKENLFVVLKLGRADRDPNKRKYIKCCPNFTLLGKQVVDICSSKFSMLWFPILSFYFE